MERTSETVAITSKGGMRGNTCIIHHDFKRGTGRNSRDMSDVISQHHDYRSDISQRKGRYSTIFLRTRLEGRKFKTDIEGEESSFLAKEVRKQEKMLNQPQKQSIYPQRGRKAQEEKKVEIQSWHRQYSWEIVMVFCKLAWKIGTKKKNLMQSCNQTRAFSSPHKNRQQKRDFVWHGNSLPSIKWSGSKWWEIEDGSAATSCISRQKSRLIKSRNRHSTTLMLDMTEQTDKISPKPFSFYLRSYWRKRQTLGHLGDIGNRPLEISYLPASAEHMFWPTVAE